MSSRTRAVTWAVVVLAAGCAGQVTTQAERRIEMDNRQAVLAAVESGDAERVRALVAEDPNSAAARDERGVSALLHALYRRNDQAAEALLAHRPELDIFEAVALGRVERLLQLVEADQALAEARSGDGFTALHLAAFFDRPDAARTLLRYGADVDAVAENPSRVRPIHSAAASGSSATVLRLLLEAGAEVDAPQSGGWTALQARTKHGDLAAVRLLMSFGADPKLAADDGTTALGLARAAGVPEIVAALTRQP